MPLQISLPLGSGVDQREIVLKTPQARLVSQKVTPIVFTSDFTFQLRATYATPQEYLAYGQSIESRTIELVWLTACQTGTVEGELLQQRTGNLGGGASLDTQFYWPPAPTGIVAGYTAPLQRWDRTVIEGLTSQPITVAEPAAQTYGPEHHNFGEEFIISPRRDPNVPQTLIEELNAQDIAAVYVYFTFGSVETRLIGLDGSIRNGPK